MQKTVLLIAAKRIGISIDDYLNRIEKEKWCTSCKSWHPKICFSIDNSRGDGLRAQCRKSRKIKPRTATERFMSKTVKERNGCLLWRGSHYPSGYGCFWYQGKLHPAHRASWLLFKGQIPIGLYVLHRCDIRLCVNPEHLFLGTHQDNMTDMKSKGRQHPLRYGDNPRAKLSGSDVLQIRKLRGVISQSRLADAFGVSKTAIRYVQIGRTWNSYGNNQAL